MDLNLDALANAIIEEYKQHTGDEKLVESFISSVGASGTYSDVYKLAKKAGLSLEQAIIDKWTFGADEVYFSTMKDLLKKTAGPMHDDIAKACLFIQDKMNKAAGIKLKSQFAPINEYDLGDIAERMKNQGITKLMGELQTLGCKMVDDNQQANMELQTSVGFEIVVSRKYDSIGLRSGTKYAERCKICVGLEGSHQFKSTREARNSGVFARHPGCGCVIDYYSKRTGTVSKNVQNYNKAVVKKEKNENSKANFVKMNLQLFADQLPHTEYIKRLSDINPVELNKAVPVARKEAKEWVNKISDNAKKLINLYTLNPNDKTPQFYERINSFIRNGYKGPKDYTEQVNIISGALKQSKLKHDYKCYRGCNYNPFEGMRAGEQRTAKQFLSTSIAKSAAFDKKYTIIIYAAKGTNAAYIEELANEKYKKQREMLFDKDVKYELLYKQGNEIAVRTIL